MAENCGCVWFRVGVALSLPTRFLVTGDNPVGEQPDQLSSVDVVVVEDGDFADRRFTNLWRHDYNDIATTEGACHRVTRNDAKLK